MRKRDPLPMRFQKKILRIGLRDAPYRGVVFVDPLNTPYGPQACVVCGYRLSRYRVG